MASTIAWLPGAVTKKTRFTRKVGYWLWDADRGEVMRCFVVPRGVVLIAGGTAAASDATFTMTAAAGSESFGILSNPYLLSASKTTNYSVDIDLSVADEFTYEESTILQMNIQDEPYNHTDGNTLRRVAEHG